MCGLIGAIVVDDDLLFDVRYPVYFVPRQTAQQQEYGYHHPYQQSLPRLGFPQHWPVANHRDRQVALVCCYTKLHFGFPEGANTGVS